MVWNPWVEKAAAMADLPDQDYKNFVCVEAGYVADRYQLAPGKTLETSQTIAKL